MISAVKNYLTAQLVAAGAPATAIYTDAAEAERHKRPPWASVLTASERDAEEFSRVDQRISRTWDEETNAYTHLVKVFNHILYLDVIIAGADLQAAETIRDKFMAGLAKGIVIDPAQANGYALVGADPATLGPTHCWAGIDVQTGIVSDVAAHISQEDQINLRLVITGGLVTQRTVPALVGVDLDAEYAEVGEDEHEQA